VNGIEYPYILYAWPFEVIANRVHSLLLPFRPGRVAMAPSSEQVLVTWCVGVVRSRDGRQIDRRHPHIARFDLAFVR